MSTDTVQAIIDDVQNYIANPSLIRQRVLNHLENVTNGTIDIVDATNPFVALLSSACVVSAATSAKTASRMRKVYSTLSQEAEDLYYHMSDKEYDGRFGFPSTVNVGFLFKKSELLNSLVLDNTTGISKLVIPRNTQVTVSDTVFSIQYPVEIRLAKHGGLQVVYDTDITSPLLSLSTNQIEWKESRANNIDWIYFTLEMKQFVINSVSLSSNNATKCQTTVSFNDNYYYTRVYLRNARTNKWDEVLTTHNALVHDKDTVTAVLKVVDKTVQVSIPQIYITSGLVTTDFRVDVYTTKGDINIDLGSFADTEYVAKFQSFDESEIDDFVAPLKNIQTFTMISNSVTTGGKDSMTFAELQAAVNNNALGDPVLPITNSKLDGKSSIGGFEIVRNIDNLTNRVLLATRQLPTPKVSSLITPAGAGISTITTAFTKAASMSTVLNNDTSITITPDQIYQSVDGVISFYPPDEVDALLKLSPEQRALAIANLTLFYSPFHYVLDASGTRFDARAYYLDGPAAVAKSFIAENDTTLIQVATGSYSVEKTKTGYRLHVLTESGDDFKLIDPSNINVQLSYIPAGESGRAYMNGTYVGKDPDTKERMYVFDIESNFNVSSEHNLELTSFSMFSKDPIITKAPLDASFDIVYTTNVTMGSQWKSSSVDKIMGHLLLPAKSVGLAHEQIEIRFGYALKTLWTQARTIEGETSYRRYLTDVYYTYEEDVYDQNPVTKSTVFFDADGKPYQKLLHRRGDYQLDPVTNAPLIRFNKNDIIRDSITGNPIEENPRTLLRQFDVMLLEGIYWFGNDTSARSYRQEMVDTLLSWLITGLGAIQGVVLEQSKIYFHPKATSGQINVLTADGRSITIDAGQSFQLNLYVPKSVYENEALKNELTTTSIKTLNSSLSGSIVSTASMFKALKDVYGDDVTAFELTGLGGSLNLPALSVMDDAARCGIRKKLVAQPDNTLIVAEDVTVNFYQFGS